jgi:hypothetical protein
MHIPYCHFSLRKFFHITDNEQSYNPKSTVIARNRNFDYKSKDIKYLHNGFDHIKIKI